MLAVLVGAWVSVGSLSVGRETVNAATDSHDVAMLGCLSPAFGATFFRPAGMR
jgi:hypothetical protein